MRVTILTAQHTQPIVANAGVNTFAFDTLV